jgi:hypothetical protein
MKDCENLKIFASVMSNCKSMLKTQRYTTVTTLGSKKYAIAAGSAATIATCAKMVLSASQG